jgi:hypothetical protein
MREDGLLWHGEMNCMQNELVHDLSKKHPVVSHRLLYFDELVVWWLTLKLANSKDAYVTQLYVQTLARGALKLI